MGLLFPHFTVAKNVASEKSASPENVASEK